MRIINFAHAADDVDISGLESAVTSKVGLESFTNLGSLFSGNVLNILFTIVGIFFFFGVVMAGWDYLLSSGDPKKISAASTRFLNSIIGLLLTITAFVVVRIVASFVGVGGAGSPGI